MGVLPRPQRWRRRRPSTIKQTIPKEFLFVLFSYTLLFVSFLVRHRRPSCARCVVVYIFFRSFHFICRFEVNNKYTLIRCDNGREKQREAKQFVWLHQRCAVCVQFICCIFIFVLFLSRVLMKKIQLQATEWQRNNNNRVVNAVPTEALTGNRIVCAACEISDSVDATATIREKAGHNVRLCSILLIDKDFACFPKSSHRNPQTAISFLSQQMGDDETMISRLRAPYQCYCSCIAHTRFHALLHWRCVDAHRLSSKFIDLVHRDNRKHDPMRCSFLFYMLSLSLSLVRPLVSQICMPNGARSC